ncbi:MAG: AIR synthase-related protein, partial [Fibrobacter sp.]|nr:AIR synthase-related protein [Fibrobacter sp.]
SDVFEETQNTFARELLRPHRSYLPVHGLIQKGLIKGCAHITGGGFYDNVDRVLPSDCNAVVDAKTWIPDPIFSWLQRNGNVENEEMYHTFNMGIGFVLAVDPNNADTVLKSRELEGFEPVVIGNVVKGNASVVVEF